MNLGMELEREVSPATYLWEHRHEFPDFSNPDVLPAAIEVGMALENWQLDRARRGWRIVVSAAREAGRSAGLARVTLRGIVGDIDRVRDAVELVLFDGRLPPDLAVRAARSTAKMCNRAIEHAIASYWEALRSGGNEVQPVPTW
ncbi:MAG: hypothetical protein PVJ43_13790 [Gemmatimonadales bacterium]